MIVLEDGHIIHVYSKFVYHGQYKHLTFWTLSKYNVLIAYGMLYQCKERRSPHTDTYKLFSGLATMRREKDEPMSAYIQRYKS